MRTRNGCNLASRNCRERYVDQCVIRVLGDGFDPERFLSTTKLTASSVFRKGEQRSGRRRPATTSGFTCDVGGGELEEQVRLASKFISRHSADLERLATTTTVESYFVDFAYKCRLDDASTMVQRDFLPVDFIRLAARVGIGVCLSQYKPVSDDTPELAKE